MRASFSMPSDTRLAEFLASKKHKTFSYSDVGATLEKPPQSFDNDHNFIHLGEGEQVWANAKNTLKNWKQFPDTWTRVFPSIENIKKDKTVAVMFRLFGIWWINSAKIVYTIDEPDRFGFAYGTLPGHLEKGEECFWIEKDKKGSVFYHIKAFSKPAYWLVWLAYPIARKFQKRFVRESLSIMKKISSKAIETHAPKPI